VLPFVILLEEKLPDVIEKRGRKSGCGRYEDVKEDTKHLR
jgi:hypothetical protein